MTKHFWLVAILSTLACVSIAAGQTVRFVRANITTSVDGQSWATAYKYLQEAVDEANGGGIDEIHIAAGTYYPDEGAGHTPNSRNESFVFDEDTNGLLVIGGFPANGGIYPDDYAPVANPTILSGDLTQNDGPSPFEDDDENSYHVMVVLNDNPGGSSGLFVRGVTITGGNANLDDNDLDGYFTMGGGGVLVTLDYGDDLHGDDSRVELRDCTIYRNTATLCGGGVLVNDRVSAVLRDSIIAENSSQETSQATILGFGGGGVAVFGDGMEVAGCTIRGNGSLAGNGGGLLSFGGVYVGNTRFLSNLAGDGAGGGAWGISIVYNSTFIDNIAYGDFGNGGGLAYGDYVANCTIVHNIATQRGGGLYGGGGDVVNSIVYCNHASIIATCSPGGTPIPHSEQIWNYTDLYCCIEDYDGSLCGSIGTPTSFDGPPDFVDPNGVDNVLGTDDDDVRLRPGSICIDAGLNSLIAADAADVNDNPSDDTSPVVIDYDGEDRIINDDVDMGAFEIPDFTPCDTDLNGDCYTQGLDLAILLGQWTGTSTYSPCPPYQTADFNTDCKVNGTDLAILLGEWGPCPTGSCGEGGEAPTCAESEEEEGEGLMAGGGGGEESETQDEELSLFLDWLETSDWDAFFAWLEEWSG